MTDSTLVIPGADAALLGYVARCGQLPIAVYDHEKLVAHFVASGMSEDEAVEWVDVNVVGAWVGAGTPGVLVRATREDLDELIGGEPTP